MRSRGSRLRAAPPLHFVALASALGSLACGELSSELSGTGGRSGGGADGTGSTSTDGGTGASGGGAAGSQPIDEIQSAPAVLVEAERGRLGTNVRLVTDTGGARATYVTAIDDAKDPPPSFDAPSVWGLVVQFPEAGEYRLYARLRIGPDGANDDSFFANLPTGSEPNWVTLNQIEGFAVEGEPGHLPGAVVDSRGGAATPGAWRWAVFDEASFTVNDGELSRTLHFATRETGLDIDKLAFALEPEGYATAFTTGQLDRGEPGLLRPKPPLPPAFEPPSDQPPLVAAGSPRYLGMVCCGTQRPFLENYFNQVTPENAGKWGSVERERGLYDWAQLDEAVQVATDAGLPFRFHVLLWGSQQPSWIAELPPAQQLEAIREWFTAVSERYGTQLTYVEVVNEFLHQPPTAANQGNYYAALGGAGESGFDWVLTAFRMAREIFPDTARLMLNEYGVLSSDSVTATYVRLVRVLQEEALIDAIGVQGHAFSTRGDADEMLARIGRLGETGLPVFITEMDVDGPELEQLLDYRRLFRPFWEHPQVFGITLWGYRPGMWRDDQEATLVHANGAEKLALRWLKGYLRGTAPVVSAPASVAISRDAGAGALVATLGVNDATNDSRGTEVVWGIEEDGTAGALELDDGGQLLLTRSLPAGTHSVVVYADVDATLSEPHVLTINVE